MKKLEQLLGEAAGTTLLDVLNNFLKEACTLALKNIGAHVEATKPGVRLGVSFSGQSKSDIDFHFYASLTPEGGAFTLSLTIEYAHWDSGKEEEESIAIGSTVDELARKVQKHITF
jgi:hypothetical protein